MPEHTSINYLTLDNITTVRYYLQKAGFAWSELTPHRVEKIRGNCQTPFAAKKPLPSTLSAKQLMILKWPKTYKSVIHGKLQLDAQGLFCNLFCMPIVAKNMNPVVCFSVQDGPERAMNILHDAASNVMASKAMLSIGK